MQATTPSVLGVFERSRILRIPFFQRQYVWEKKDWTRFVDDMYSLLDSQSEYFLGALILKEEPVEQSERTFGIREKLSVVDGQQRLTTLSILIKVLSLLLDRNTDFDYQFKNNNNERTPVLHHNINDRAAYEEVMNLEVAREITVHREKNIVRAYEFFKNELNRRGQLLDLYNAIFAHVCFVEIKLHSQDNEKQIFETINSLGVDLTTDELLKNFLYNPGEEDHYVNDWKPAFDSDEARKFWGTDDASRSQAKTNKTKVVETFILHFVKIQMWKYRNRFDANDRKRLVAKNDLFNSCKMFVNNYGEDRIALANEIIEYANLYRQYFDKDYLNNRIPSQSCIERLACYAMAKETTIIPYLLYILRNVENVDERNKMFDYLEKFLLRRIVSMKKETNKNFVEFFSETLIGNEIDSYDKLVERIGSIEITQNHAMPTDEMIDTYINDIKVDDNTAKLFLYMIETRMVYRNGIGFNQFGIDAIMPKPSPKNERTWARYEDDLLETVRNTRSQNIGNYLLLINQNNQAPDTSSIKDSAWTDKVDRLKEWSQEIRTSQWFRQINNWNEGQIANRNTQIATIVKDMFRL